jgi:hypothetical protein
MVDGMVVENSPPQVLPVEVEVELLMFVELLTHSLTASSWAEEAEVEPTTL